MKRILAAVMFLFITAISYGAFYANMVEEDAYISSMESFDKKDFTAAKKGFEEFLAKFPESKYKPTALLRLAELKEDMSSIEKAYNDVMKAYPASEYEAEAAFSLGRIFYSRGDYKKSREYLNIILNKYPNMVWIEESYWYLLLCYLAEKNYTLVDKAYAEYLSKKDFFIQKKRIQLAYADSLMERDKYAEAAAMYKELIDKASSDDRYIYLPAVYKRAAEAYEKAGNADSAEILSTDLKLKFPDSDEATGKAQKPAATAAPSAAATPKADIIPTVSSTAASKEFYTIQVGAYTNKKFCDYTAKQYENKKYKVYVKKDGKFYRLMVGKFNTKAEADAFAPGFAKKEKLKSYLVKQAWE